MDSKRQQLEEVNTVKHTRYKQKHKQHTRQDHKNTQKCRNCGNFWHKNGRETCPARSVTCHSCGKTGNFVKVCLSSQNCKRSITKKQEHKNKVASLNTNSNMSESSSSSSALKLYTNRTSEIPSTLVKLNNTKINVIIDTGSSVNLINLNTFKKILSGRLTKGDTTVFPYNSSTKLPIVGKFMGTFEHNNAKTEAVFVIKGEAEPLLSYQTSKQLTLVNLALNNPVFVIKGEAEPLLSYQTSKQLTLVNLALNNRQHIDTSFVESKYPNKGVGNLTNHEVNLHINQQIKPVTQTYRRIPFSIRERYVSPTVDDILSQLNGAKVFSKLDLKEGYQQLTLNEQSPQITTFATHIGLFRYKRLNFGINSAAEIFRRTIKQILADIPNVINISDILIFGKNEQEHNDTLI
ncbi:hypothetical protein QE152_g24868 [Popillia japonica]|uniref:Reverse transcriptase domain-containing protein n=1 Tax=Popillia japonica TaxID=7064 RepID=A0AAW1K2E3_POPJA